MKIMEKDILEEIVAAKRIEVARRKEAVGIGMLALRCEEREQGMDGNRNGEGRSMLRNLERSATGIIAEFKRKSPSKGWICRDADIEDVCRGYEKAGASAISVLTDSPYFGGSLEDLSRGRSATGLPVLRKDFIIDPYQLFEARAAGADAVLLIASVLDAARCRNLGSTARSLGLEVLLEIHREEELDRINEFTDMIGVNNRNLGTFRTDVENSFRLAEKLPREKLWISESGISGPETVKLLREAGYRGFLIGERFMKTGRPADALESFLAGYGSLCGDCVKSFENAAF